MYTYSKPDQQWFFDEPTKAQIRLMDSIVDVIPELKEKRNKCNTKGLASRFIDSYKERYNEIKADRIAMLEEETWRNISSNE